MHSKLIGGTLLMIGTTIGAGMLALPIATSQLGFFGSIIMLVSCWAIMTTSAFVFLEVNLWLPPNTNLISMAGATLGKSGQALTWVTYLVLLYAIISAYIAGGGDLFHYLLATSGIPVPLWLAATLFTAIFASVVYLGIRAVDYVNRGLMFGKMGAYLLLVLLIFPFVSSVNLSDGNLKHLLAPSGLTVTAVAFGSLMVIPSLRTYFDDDVASLRKAIFIGTFIPLLCYIAWDMVIMGVIPVSGTPGLQEMLHSASANSDLLHALTTILQKESVTTLAKFFTSICMATSFLSVSLSLSDFLFDGFNVAKRGMGNVFVYALTYVPPLAIAVFYPDAFIRALKYAGVSVFILMILLPPLMAWRGRYHCDLAMDATQVRGGKFLLGLLVVFALLMIGFGIEGVL